MDGSGPNGNLIGSDYRAAYAPGVTNTGTGQIVGLFEYDSFYPSDIASYESQANMTNPPPVDTVLVAGFNGVPGVGDGEVALDIEMVMSMAPGLSNIIAYEADTNTTANVVLSIMATNTAVKQFTCSWDFASTNSRVTMDGYFKKMAAQGQSFFNASGDTGAYVGLIPEPDDDTNITIVGGTTLSTSGPGGSWLGEVTWNAPDIESASGGGISTLNLIPTWQSGVHTAANAASTTHRNIPDVAIVADNIYIVADNGLAETSGGTSASAQLWGGFAALINQQSEADGHTNIGFINPALYAAYKTIAYSAILDDITAGNNTNGDTGFFAAPGYDLCTGLGTPTGTSLMAALEFTNGFLIVPGRGFTANGPAGGPFNITGQTILLTNTGAKSLSWALGGAPDWLNVSPQSGAVSPGGAAASVTVNLNPVVDSMAVGVYTANVWFTNLTSGLAQLRQFTLQVGQNLVHDGGFESFDFCYWTLSGFDAIYYDFVDDGYYLPPYNAYSGLCYAAFGESNAVADVSQLLPTRPGQVYQISLWLENPSGLSPNQFIVEWNTADSTNVIHSQSDVNALNWENLQFTAVATTNTTRLQLEFEDDPDYLLLDDVSVVPVPMTIQSAQQSGQTLAITVNTLPGLVYQLQSTSTLFQPQWINVGNPTAATGTTLTLTPPIAAGAPEFYRIELLPQL